MIAVQSNLNSKGKTANSFHNTNRTNDGKTIPKKRKERKTGKLYACTQTYRVDWETFSKQFADEQ